MSQSDRARRRWRYLIAIYINTVSEMDDTSKELRAFWDYVAGKKPDDAFAKKLEEAVKQAKKNREWRHDIVNA